MREWLDSAQAPNSTQIAAARAAGYSGWAGYFAGPNVLHGWEQTDFDRVKQGGLDTLAYCSGGQDPVAAATQSLAWDVSIILDDEPRMRSPGSWRQNWLNSSGAGHYGNYWVFPGLSAPINILAAYPGSSDPVDTWWSQTPRPPGLCGWQWAGSHDFAGITVDSSWMDDLIGVKMEAIIKAMAQALGVVDVNGNVVSSLPNYLGFINNEVRFEQATVQKIKAEVDQLLAHPVVVNSTDPALMALVQSIAAHFTGK